MKRFSPLFLVTLLTFLIGTGAFAGWLLLRKNTFPEDARPKSSNTQADSEIQAKIMLQWAELNDILKRYNIHASVATNNYEGFEIEEADARLYSPLVGETIFLSADVPTKDSDGVKPRYWLRVEDYSTAEQAQKRAKEYISEGTYDRMAKAYGKADAFIMSKFSRRLWAVARGKRVYALTTNANLLTYIDLQKKLKESVSELPEI